MRRGTLFLGLVLGVISAGAATAQMSDPRPIPQAGPTYLGTVVASDVHSVTIETADGQQLVLETDSRTMMPYRLLNGTRVRAEFHLMDSGMRHAGRITPLTAGSLEMAMLDEQLHDAALRAERERMERERYQQNQPSEEVVAASYEQHEQRDADDDRTAANGASTQATDKEDAEDNDKDDASTTTTDREDELPRTGGVQPAFLAAGLFALGAGLGIAFGRRNASA